MKKITLLTLLTVSAFQAFAQDIIVKNDKTEVKAKIEELTETTIKYKKFEMLDGPIYNISLNDVFMIIYKNGTKEYIQSKTKPLTQANLPINTLNNTQINGVEPSSGNNLNTTNASFHQPMVKIKKGYYSFEGNELKSHSDYVYTFEKYGYKDLAGRYKEGKSLSLMGSGAGIVSIIVGAATKQYILVGCGALIGVIGSTVGNNTRENAIKQFNARATKSVSLHSNLELKPFFASNQMGNQVGVSFGF